MATVEQVIARSKCNNQFLMFSHLSRRRGVTKTTRTGKYLFPPDVTFLVTQLWSGATATTHRPLWSTCRMISYLSCEPSRRFSLWTKEDTLRNLGLSLSVLFSPFYTSVGFGDRNSVSINYPSSHAWWVKISMDWWRMKLRLYHLWGEEAGVVSCRFFTMVSLVVLSLSVKPTRWMVAGCNNK